MSSKYPNNEPRSLLELFYVFSLITLQGFGGVISIMQRHLVEKRKWFSQADFLEMFSLSQVLPGPNVCNLALMIGAVEEEILYKYYACYMTQLLCVVCVYLYNK